MKGKVPNLYPGSAEVDRRFIPEIPFRVRDFKIAGLTNGTKTDSNKKCGAMLLKKWESPGGQQKTCIGSWVNKKWPGALALCRFLLVLLPSMRRRKNAVRHAGAQVPVYQMRVQLREPLRRKRKLVLEGRTLLPSKSISFFWLDQLGVIGELFFLETMSVRYRLFLFSFF